MKAIVYARFSTLEQGKGDSIDRQMAACLPYCESQGWEVEEIIQDSGKSGFKADHRNSGELGRFEREALDGEHAGKVLVIESLDRLSRQDHNETYDIIRLFQRSGVSIATVDGPRLYEAYGSIDFSLMIELIVKARMNHEASLTKSRHLKSQWAGRRGKAIEQKSIVTALCPAWLEPKKDRSGFLIIGEGKGFKQDRGEIVRQIFEWADQGLGSLKIVRKLNEMKVPTWPRFKGRTAQSWQRSFIVRLLQDVSVTGDYQPMKYDEQRNRVPACEPIRGYYPRIVDPDMFQRVSVAAVDRKAVRGQRSSVLVNLVSGLAFCHSCGGRMVYRQAAGIGKQRLKDGKPQAPLKRPAASLICDNRETRGGCEWAGSISYTALEKALVSDALHLAMDDKAFARRDEVAKLNVQIADRRRDHDIAHQSAVDLWMSAGSSEIAKSLAMKREAEAASIKEEIETLEKVRDTAEGRASAAEHLSRLQEVRDNLLHPDLETRAKHRAKVAQGFRSVIDHITCYPGRYSVVFVGSMRMMDIKVEKGRREPTVSHLDTYKRSRDTADMSINETALAKRMENDPRTAWQSRG